MSNLMRRVAPALALGGAAVALVTLFDPGLHGSSNAVAAGTLPTAKPAKATTDGTTPNASAPTAQVAPTQAAPTPAAPTPAATDCSTAKQITGSTVQTQFGPVQVVAKVAGGKVCSADAIQYPNADGRSAYISQQAIPMLNQQAVASGAKLSGVSGASYTSAGYAQSLQSILSKTG